VCRWHSAQSPSARPRARLCSLPVSRALRATWWTVPLAIFAVTRILSGLLIVLVARDQISASQLPADMPLPTLVDPASYLHVIANWDGQWYRLIAAHGYPSGLPTSHGVVQQNAWAFYPLFPALVRLVMTSCLSFGLAASLGNLAAAAAPMCLLHPMPLAGTPRFTSRLTRLAPCSSPASPIFQTAYAESLARRLLFAALWALQRERSVLSALAGLGLSLIRGIAPALVVVVAWECLRRRSAREAFEATDRRGLLLSGLVV